MKIGFLIDPPASLDSSKDSSIALMRSAAEAGFEIIIFTVDQMRLGTKGLEIAGAEIEMQDQAASWYTKKSDWQGQSAELDLILLRLDPPIDSKFRAACAMLAAAAKCPVLNNPTSVLARDEKIAALAYPDLCPPTLISTDRNELLAYASTLKDGCVIKPLNRMGGQGIFAFAAGDSNIRTAISELADKDDAVIVQHRIARLSQGDCRVFIIDGKPCDVMLNRLPQPGEHIANMVAGGTTKVMPLGEREKAIGDAIGPDLKQAGIVFAGLDVIDGYLTEINITCPTGLVQVYKQSKVDLASQIIACACSAAG